MKVVYHKISTHTTFFFEKCCVLEFFQNGSNDLSHFCMIVEDNGASMFVENSKIKILLYLEFFTPTNLGIQ